MIALLFGLLQLAQAAAPPAVEGCGAPAFRIPRIEAEVTIDGHLDEPAWAKACRMTEFWQYQPVDGRPAEEKTEVLVWYSPSALHFGIIARDSQPGAIRATVADRDSLSRYSYHSAKPLCLW